jgi:hypothetical protein
MKRDVAETRYAETLADLNEARADAMAVLGRQVADSHARYLAAVEVFERDDAARDAYVLRRDEFLAVRWKLTVQREAVGLTDHSWIDHAHPMAERDRRPGEVSDSQRRVMHYRLLR